MKTTLLAIGLFSVTAAAVAFYPSSQDGGPKPPPPLVDTNQAPKVEVVFALDTTGSMSGLIQTAKDKIWSIASSMAAAEPAPEIRIGLVGYRDRGDQYVTQVVDLSSDLDSVYARLMDFQAAGGGDGPESVNQALHEAVTRVSWSQDPNAYQVVFLVGDAPPHMDYQDDVKYPETAAAARRRGIVINTVQCGQATDTTPAWQRIARLGGGDYFQVEQTGGALAVASPYDKELAELSAELDKTRLYYGSADQRAAKQRKLEAADKLHAGASLESRARRAAFNASESGKSNQFGELELVEDVAGGRVDLSDLDADELPAPLVGMEPAKQQALIEETTQRRNELRDEIQDLTAKRDAYLRQKVAEMDGVEESLDHQLYGAVREQAEKKGLSYPASAPAY